LEETYQLAVSDCEVSLFLAALTNIADIDGYKLNKLKQSLK